MTEGDTPPTTTSAAEPRPSLWTIAMVHAWLLEYAPDGDETLAVCLAGDIVYDYEQECRRLTARIDQLAVALVVEKAQTAALQGQLDATRAGSFVPLPDGEYTMQNWDDHTYTLHVTSNGAELEAWGDGDENKYKDGSPKRVEEIGVGDYRLCKRTAPSAAATGKGEPVLLVDEPDKFGTITVWVDKRERFQPRVEVHTTDFADDGSLIPDYKLYFYNRTFEVQEAHDFARAILLGCEIAEQHAQQRPSAQDGQRA